MRPVVASSLRRVAWAVALAILVGPAAGADTGDQIESIFDAFYKTGLDTSTSYRVKDLTIQKDNMTLLLKKGTVYMMKPIEDEVTGAVFIGSGQASMTPPNRTQRFMLNKGYGAERLDEPFDTAVFRFCDDTDKKIVAAARSGSVDAAEAERAEEIFEKRNDLLDDLRPLQLENTLISLRRSKLQGLDFFLADLHFADHDWVTYFHGPQSFHENALIGWESSGAKARRIPDPWSIWHKASDYGPGGHYVKYPENDGPNLLRIKHTEMQLNLKDTKTVHWEARLTIETLADGLLSLPFDLSNNGDFNSDWDNDSFYPVRVSSVTDVSGQPLFHRHRKDQLLVVLPRPAPSGERLTLRVKGTAEVIYQLTAESFGLRQNTWYPQYGFSGGRSSFHWTIRVPKPYLVTGSGTVVREVEDAMNKQNLYEVRSDDRVHFPWVIFGRFQKTETTYEPEGSGRPVALTMHSFPSMTIPVTGDFRNVLNTRVSSVTLHAPVKKVDALLAESKEILKLFEKIYGPYPYEELHIAQMAPQLGFGQSPMGFVQLTGAAFLSQAVLESDFLHGFLAHEIAHQWWAHQIGWASGDDEWLSEAFAEYAAGIFVNEYQGPKRFQRTLEEWGEAARFSDQEAPIAAANTLAGPNASQHRTNLLYNKGPYVLHMLRVQMDDAKYMEVMRSLQETYKNRNITTEMLLREVNRVTGADYTYFFDQWFWDVGIPTFRYSWRANRRSDGKYVVTVHVSQEDKGRLKRVLMPMHFHFKGKGKESIVQYKPVVKAEQDVKFLLDEKPKNVTLDDENTLLADISPIR